MKFNLSTEEKNKYIAEIQDFFYNERDEEIGIIAASNFLDFYLENLGATIYNKALDDAKKWTNQKLQDMDFAYDDLYK